MLGSMVYYYFKNYTKYDVSGTFNKNKNLILNLKNLML